MDNYNKQAERYFNGSVFNQMNKSAPTVPTWDSLIKSTMTVTTDFHQLKKLAAVESDNYVAEQLLSACNKGIIRDVELFVIEAVVRGLSEAINRSLCDAAENCHVAIMDLLLQNGADINYQDELPLRKSIKSRHLESVSFLLNHGANVCLYDKFVMMCCKSGDYPDILQQLINAGADVFTHYHKCVNYCLQKGYKNSAAILVKYSCNNPRIKEQNQKEDMEKNRLIEQFDTMLQFSDQISNDEESLSYHDSGDERDIDELLTGEEYEEEIGTTDESNTTNNK